jgi:protein-tyrosine phosphatase
MNVLFVCTGNICRSPLAEGILRDKFRKLGIRGEVGSAGFEPFHAGDRADSRARKVAAAHGIDLSGHVARLFTTEDFDHFDRIFVMDSWHYRNVTRMMRSDSDMNKVDFVMNLVYPGKNVPVEDPYYEDYPAFEKAYAQLDAACDKIAEMALYKEIG